MHQPQGVHCAQQWIGGHMRFKPARLCVSLKVFMLPVCRLVPVSEEDFGSGAAEAFLPGQTVKVQVHKVRAGSRAGPRARKGLPPSPLPLSAVRAVHELL